MTAGHRLIRLIPEVPGRLVAATGLVGIACVVYSAAPVFRSSPQLFAVFELALFTVGVWAYHSVRARREAAASHRGRVIESNAQAEPIRGYEAAEARGTSDGGSDLRRVMDQLRETREEISSGYRDVVSREHAWRAFQRLATGALWDAVKDLEDDPYRQHLADVLDAAIARLQAFHLEEKHLSAIDMTLECLSAPEATEEDVDACQNAWRDVGVDTLPSLGEAFEEWLASSELRLEHAG